MNAQNNSQAQAIKEQVMVFQFSETKNEVRTLIENGDVYFVGSDVADVLGYKNSRKALKDHCRYVTKRYIPHPQNHEKKLSVNTIPEGDVFRLIIHSELESAQKFESWVMDEVLPTLRKKGFYSMSQNRSNDFIDARNIPYSRVLINDVAVRMIVIDNEEYYSINDYHGAINSRTGANQAAKKINALEKLAVKIWLFGNTHPAWFSKIKGLELLASGSRVMKSNQLSLSL